MTREKIYLNRTQSRRAWIFEIPAGDPTGGPAYGERNGDVVSAVVDVAAIALAVPTGGASLTLMGGLAMAGGALGLVGTLTGNKTLSTIGGVMGMGAGIANMAGMTGGNLNDLFSSTGTVAQSGTDQIAQDIGQVTTDSTAATANGLAGTTDAAAASTAGTVDAAQNAANNSILGGNMANPNDMISPYGSSPNTLGQATAADATGQINPNSAIDPIQSAINPSSAPGTQVSITGPNATQPGLGDGTSPTTSTGILSGANTVPGVSAPPPPAGTGGWSDAISKVGQWMNNNKTMVDVGGKFIQGMMQQLFPSGLTQAQTAYLQQQAASLAQNSAIQSQMFANGNNASQLNVNIPVTGNTQTVYGNNPQVSTGGILANNRFATSLRNA